MGDAEGDVKNAMADLLDEIDRAITKHPESFVSPHEGYSIILEELDELWEHVKGNTGRSPEAYKEAIQIAATAMRYAMQVAAK